MIPGFAGHLLSESFLEEKLLSDRNVIDVTAWRLFADARHRGQSLGPASSLRAMLDLGLGPVAEAVGFRAPRDIEVDRMLLVATLEAGSEPVVFVVAGWNE